MESLEEFQKILAKLGLSNVKIEPLEYYVSVYFPEKYYTQAQDCMTEMTKCFNGATACNGFQGSWKSPQSIIIREDILLIKSYCQLNNLIDHLEQILNTVKFYGKICQQEVMAVEIGSLMGSSLLLIPINII